MVTKSNKKMEFIAFFFAIHRNFLGSKYVCQCIKYFEFVCSQIFKKCFSTNVIDYEASSTKFGSRLGKFYNMRTPKMNFVVIFSHVKYNKCH